MPSKDFPEYTLHLFALKTSAFLQIFFLIKLLFQQIWRTSVFLNSKCLKRSNKRTHIILFINHFVSLAELKM